MRHSRIENEQSHTFSWIINNFTYLQTFIFICTLFLSLLPIGYFWIATHLERIKLIDEQLDELKEEKALENLFREVQEHRALTQKMVMLKDKEPQAEMEKLDRSIQATILDFMERDRFKRGKFTYEPSIWQKVNPRNIQNRWEALIHQVETLSHQEVEPLQTNIIHDLLIQFSYLSDKVGISYFKEIENYALIEGIFLRLPIIQENLAQLSLLSDRFLLSGGKDLSRERILMLIGVLESDLSYLRFGDNFEGILNQDLVRVTLLKALSAYTDSIDTLIKMVNTRILSEGAPTVSASEFQSYSDAALKAGYQLWNEGFRI